MHPYAIDRLVQERQDELLRLGRAERQVTLARRSRAPVRAASRIPFSLAALAARLGRRPAPPPVLEPCPRAPVRPW